MKSGKVNVPYTTRLKAKYGMKPYEWEVTTSTLPSAIQQFDAKTGRTTLFATLPGDVELHVKVKTIAGGEANSTLIVSFK